jgi:hypothetical protein
MKKSYLFIFCLLLRVAMYANDDEIILKNGTKTVIKPNSVLIDYENKSIFYITETNIKTNIKFHDLNSVQFGKNKFETLKIDGKSSVDGYFVLTETKTKKLLLKSTTLEDSEIENHEVLILNSSNEIIETYLLDSKKNNKSATIRSEIYTIIKFHFSECKDLLERLEIYDRNNTIENNIRILSFFKNPIYYDYVQSK